MPRWLHIIVQIILLAGTTLTTYHFSSPYPALIGGFLMGAVGIVNQSYNTDGTNQTVAFNPPTNPVKK